jgi:hypothetical protein
LSFAFCVCASNIALLAYQHDGGDSLMTFPTARTEKSAAFSFFFFVALGIVVAGMRKLEECLIRRGRLETAKSDINIS